MKRALVLFVLFFILWPRFSYTAEQTYLYEISVSQLENLNTSQWTNAEPMDNKNVRRVLPNTNACFTLPSWWGDSARPQEGEMYMLEIDFRDDLSSPAVVSSFGNCERSFGMSELHRIGGAGDKKWKTGCIPVSWDYLYAGEGNPAGDGKQQFGIQVQGGDRALPISEIRLRKAVPGDQERYNRETRTWVEKKQESCDPSKISDPQPASPEIPEGWGAKACIPFLESCLKPIYPTDAPDKDSVGKALKMRMSLNELENAQFGIYAHGRELKDVSFTVSSMVNSAGETLTAEVNTYTVEYALEAGADGKIRTTPQRLWPMFEATIQPGHSQAFWIVVESKEQTTIPGTYHGEIVVDVKEPKITERIPLEIVVMPIRLLSMKEAGLHMGANVYGYVPFHSISYALKNNINGADLWYFCAHPVLNKIEGNLEIDFTLMNEWMKEAKRRGWEKIVYYLGGDPAGFPNTLSAERDIYMTMHQGEADSQTFRTKFAKLAGEPGARDRVLKEIRGQYGRWLQKLIGSAWMHGWPELILTPLDEPGKYALPPQKDRSPDCIGSGPWIKTHFEDTCKLIRQQAPRTRIYVSVHDLHALAFIPDADVIDDEVIDQDAEAPDKVTEAGGHKECWLFDGGGVDARYVYGFYFGSFASKGSGMWAYNWGDDKFDLSKGGQWCLCWDTPFATIPTLGLESLREGWDDRRYMETLRKAAKEVGKEQEANDFLKKIFEQAVIIQDKDGKVTANAPHKPPEKLKDPATLDAFRYQIADKILEYLEQKK